MKPRLATTFLVGLCPDPKCRSLHFDLQDEEGRIFASAQVPVEGTVKLIESIRDIAYRIVTTKDG